MGLMKELSDLNNIYQGMYEVDEAMVVTNADKKANTPAYHHYYQKNTPAYYHYYQTNAPAYCTGEQQFCCLGYFT